MVVRVARYALQLDSVQRPDQLTVVTMKFTAEAFADRVQLYRNMYHWVWAVIGEAARLRDTWRAELWQ